MAAQEFRIDGDSPAKGDLMFWYIAGYECVGRASAYELRVLSKSGIITPKQILGHAFDVVIGFDDASGSMHERHAHGYAVRFARLAKVGRYFQYHISLRSWFGLLSRRVNSRIYQEQGVLEVMDEVLDSSSVGKVKKLDKDNVITNHPPRRYCVQHQETDAAFISRLLEDEGIYYWFDAHDAPGTMHLSDTSTVAHSPLPADKQLKQWAYQAGTQPRFNELFYLTPVSQAGSGAYASRDSDFKVIGKKLLGDKSDPDSHELADMEVFEFPGGYFNPDDREGHARVRMEELAARRELFDGRTNWSDVAVGKSFEYTGAEPGGAPDGDYLIVSCMFCVRQPGYEGVDGSRQMKAMQEQLVPLILEHVRDDPLFKGSADMRHSWLELQLREVIAAGVNDEAQGAQGRFGITAIQAQVPFRPPRLMPRPIMPGPQSAIVVGPEGDEIFADPHGRVKVQFHWDRYGQSDENSTCWVRVSQPWAGKGWGAYFIPRIGQEVIVDFLNGDPDRPIIIGRVYNNEQTLPFTSHTQSGIKTRSTPDGDTSTFNELRFEDAKGKEQIHVHAEKDLDVLVEKMETRKVGTNRFTKVAGMCQTSIGGKRTADVGKDDILKVVGSQTFTIGAEQGLTVQKKASYVYLALWKAAADSIEFSAVTTYKLSAVSISNIAQAAYSIKAATYTLDAPIVTVSATTVQQDASKAQNITAGDIVNMGASVVHISGKSAIILECGGSSLTITPVGIVLKAATISQKGDAGVQIGAPNVAIAGDALVKVDGGIVKINT